MKNIKYIGLSVWIAVCLASCSTSKTLVSSGEYDDMYGSSSDSRVVLAPTISRSMEDYSPEYLAQYNDAFDRNPSDTGIVGTDSYYVENYVNARDLKRAYTPDAGYSSGYASGYAEGWNNNAWSGGGFNGMNSFNSPFGFNSFAYSPFRSSFGSYLSYSPFAYGGYYGLSSFGNSFGGFSPFGNSPFGFNSYGYNPWGNSSYGYNSFGYNNYGMGGMYGSNPYYNVQAILANGSFNDANLGGNRSYGPRSGGRSSGVYNDGFINTRRPNSSAVASSRLAPSSLADRANGRSVVSPTVGRAYDPISRRPTSYDAYTSNRTATSSNARSSSANTNSYAGSSSSYGTPSSSTRNASTYSRANSDSRSYTPSTNNNGSAYSRGNTNTDYSSRRPSTYSSPSSSPSNSGYSRGSSSGSSSSPSSSSRSSSGGTSRGPR
jgi:hypothetical protein